MEKTSLRKEEYTRLVASERLENWWFKINFDVFFLFITMFLNL